MARAAILVDGSETEFREDVIVPIQAMDGRRPRPWIGIGIGVLTAVVAMGALGGEDRPSADAAGGLAGACVAPSATAEAIGAGTGADVAVVGAPTSAAPPYDWWNHSAVIVWVDPATGLLRQRGRPGEVMADVRRGP